MPFGEYRAKTRSGAAVLFCTVTPALTTSEGNCEFACMVRICARIWSVFGSVAMSKFTVSVMEPLLALTLCM